MKTLIATQQEITHFTHTHSSWNEVDNTLHKDFEFNDFSEAFAFMTRVAMLAECLDHHPEWSNVYKHVSIHLTTHESGGITSKDFEFAEKIDNILRKN